VTDTTTRKSVLVVEDDELLNSLIIKMLISTGLQAEGVVCGRDAINRIIGGRVDVLLLDQQLPDMTGQDVISTLSLHGIRVPFVVMTGQGDERLAVEMMKFGAADYLVKDNNLTHILPGVIERTLRAIESERLLRSAENALKESEKRFRSLFQDVPAVAVQGYNADGIIQYWNRAAAKLYGYAADEAIGRNVLDLITPEAMREEVAESIRKMIDTGGAIPTCELNMVRKDGSIVTVLSSHAVVRNANREPELFRIDIDMTSRQQAEFERERLQTQLTQAQRMEAVGRLAGGVAHDFNNMLGVIFGHTELLISQTTGQDPIIESLNEIRTAAQRSADLTRQLLAFARKQNAIPVVLDLNQAVESILKMLSRLVGEGINLTWAPGNNVGSVRMDPSQIDQILANLCVNARDAIADTGSITIKTAVKTLDAEQCLEHVDFIPGEYALLAVNDDGCGMDAETMSNIFEPFFTTKPIDKGTGLGLATVYGIVRQNHGFIAVKSKLGTGTEFEIYLPLFRKQPPSPAQQNLTDVQHNSCHERILLVEDNRALLEMIGGMLNRIGYQVMPANNPNKAIELARDCKENIDLLVTDVIMPDMNGRTLFGYIQTLHPETRCLFMSGYTADVISQHGVLDEGVDFIQKPFVTKDLIAKINGVMRRNQSQAEQADSEQDFV